MTTVNTPCIPFRRTRIITALWWAVSALYTAAFVWLVLTHWNEFLGWVLGALSVVVANHARNRPTGDRRVAEYRAARAELAAYTLHQDTLGLAGIPTAADPDPTAGPDEEFVRLSMRVESARAAVPVWRRVMCAS